MSGNELYDLLSDVKGDYSKEIKKIVGFSSRKQYHFSDWYYHRYWMGAAAFLCVIFLVMHPLFSRPLTFDPVVAAEGTRFRMVVGNEVIPLSVSRSFTLDYGSQIGMNAFYKEYEGLDQVNDFIGEELLLPKEGGWQLLSDPIYVVEGIGQSVIIQTEFTNEYNQQITVQVLLQSDRWGDQEHSVLIGRSDQDFCCLIDQYVWEKQDTDVYIAAYNIKEGITYYTAFFVYNDIIYVFNSGQLDTLYQFIESL